ncbi:RNA polymerase II transcriptional coactivator KELP-like protein [Quillaja saponaria]|uniref:RNA polymerase II transcriptional coactivator KELP-like protein n=1 Tax=Quillaja saponaria TaxID=32244 RepID=A0AAD7PNZ7_QUISA|nr:RNA polymerase II transcriptional coactivator KELP-like protein [Quillaja saponaria]
MEPETRRKIEDTVIDILNKSNMEEMTEFKVRATASEWLRIDLSSLEKKGIVRSVVESYLLGNVEDKGKDKEGELSVQEQTQEAVREEQEARPKKEVNEDGDRVMCQLSNRRSVTIQEFKGKTLVSIREYYPKDGKLLPSPKGISLSTEQWSSFRKSVPAIEEAIKKMETKLRSEVEDEEIEVSNPVTSAVPHELAPVEVNRFDGKNYHSWVQKMEAFLQQLRMEYVLTDPCPNVRLGPDVSAAEIAQAKVAEQRWVNDDYMCRRNILSYLSDHLFNQYANKPMSARELWEELKLVYLYEEYGTKRSQVKKYIDFQMVDEKPILEQVQEFNGIADSIVAAGMLIDENFHVSVIISKLPPSWKNFCLKLMPEEYLPFWMLMERLRIEEESRNQARQGEHSNHVGYHQAEKLVPRMTGIRSPGMHRKRDLDMDGKTIVCYTCGKKGHLSKHCRRKFDKKSNERKFEQNGSLPATPEVNMVGAMV